MALFKRNITVKSQVPLPVFICDISMYYHMIIPVYDVLSHIWLNKSLIMALHLHCSISYYYRIVNLEINICFTEMNCRMTVYAYFCGFQKENATEMVWESMYYSEHIG